MKAANFLVSSFRSTAATSSKGIAWVFGSSGPNPPRQNSLSIKESAPQVRPWKARSAYSRPSRPVTPRENLMAVSTPSLPELAKKTLRSLPPANLHRRSASSPAKSETWLCSIAGPERSSSSFKAWIMRSEEHTSELQSLRHLVCRLLLEKKRKSWQHLRE